MSRKPSFANLRGTVAPNIPVLSAAPSVDPERTPAGRADRGASTRPVSREGRKQIAGFFTPDLSLAMHMLARRQGRSLQALMAEAFNDVLRKYGESPVGE